MCLPHAAGLLQAQQPCGSLNGLHSPSPLGTMAGGGFTPYGMDLTGKHRVEKLSHLNCILSRLHMFTMQQPFCLACYLKCQPLIATSHTAALCLQVVRPPSSSVRPTSVLSFLSWMLSAIYREALGKTCWRQSLEGMRAIGPCSNYDVDDLTKRAWMSFCNRPKSRPSIVSACQRDSPPYLLTREQHIYPCSPDGVIPPDGFRVMHCICMSTNR